MLITPACVASELRETDERVANSMPWNAAVLSTANELQISAETFLSQHAELRVSWEEVGLTPGKEEETFFSRFIFGVGWFIGSSFSSSMFLLGSRFKLSRFES